MKKIILLLLALNTLTFAHPGDHKHYGVIETRVERKFQTKDMFNTKDYDVDIDVDIEKEQMNFEIELEGYHEPQLDISKIVENILLVTSQEAPEVKEIDISIIFDPEEGNEKLLYNERHFLKK